MTLLLTGVKWASTQNPGSFNSLPTLQGRAGYNRAEVGLQADFRNLAFLSQYVSEMGKLIPRRRTHLKHKVQRHLCRQIKVLTPLPSAPTVESTHLCVCVCVCVRAGLRAIDCLCVYVCAPAQVRRCRCVFACMNKRGLSVHCLGTGSHVTPPHDGGM